MCLSAFWKWCCAVLVTFLPLGPTTSAQVNLPSAPQLSRHHRVVCLTDQEWEGAPLGVTSNAQSADGESGHPRFRPARFDDGAIYIRQASLELRVLSTEPPSDAEPARLDVGATYTRQALLELRRPSTEPPCDEVIALLRRLGLRRRRRGVRAGRKSRRPIRVRVTARTASSYAERECIAPNPMQSLPSYRERVEHLTRPPRLTIRQTRQAEIRAEAARRSALNVGHLNVRSLTAHIDELNHLLLSERLDVLCVSETWLTNAVETRMLQFPGYDISRCDRRGGKSGGGAAIIYRSTMTAEPLRVPAATSRPRESLAAAQSDVTDHRSRRLPAAVESDDSGHR